MEKKDEEKIKEIVENLKVYRGVFVRKSELIQKLEEAFPDKEDMNKTLDKIDQDVNKIAGGF